VDCVPNISSIENQLHWYPDITFNEDKCRARAGYASQNLSVPRKMALYIVSEQKDKLSFKKRLYKAASDKSYLKKLLEI
jgi:predicted transposase YbfD/YdcC